MRFLRITTPLLCFHELLTIFLKMSPKSLNSDPFVYLSVLPIKPWYHRSWLVSTFKQIISHLFFFFFPFSFILLSSFLFSCLIPLRFHYQQLLCLWSFLVSHPLFSTATNSPKWWAAMAEEISALLEQGTWTLVRANSHQNIIRCRWFYKVKPKSDSSLERYKKID